MEEILKLLREFNSARNWNDDHSPKNLIMALSVEVAELMEVMQWTSESDSYKLNKNSVRTELADIFIYSLIIADKFGIIDIEEMIRKKIMLNGLKYPIIK